jgi:hypothetical protein
MRLIARSRRKAQNKGLWGAECLGVNVFRVSHISWRRRCHLDEWYFLVSFLTTLLKLPCLMGLLNILRFSFVGAWYSTNIEVDCEPNGAFRWK